jgi:hypothetical protein
MPYYLHYEWQDQETGDDVFIDLKFDTEEEYLRVKQDIEAHPDDDDLLERYERQYADGYVRPDWHLRLE